MRQLYPDACEVTLDELAEHYARNQAPHSPGRPFVRVNMATSLDGVTRGASGTSVDVSGADDRDLLLLLRACADAVLVGASTVRAYPYRAPGAHPRWQALRNSLGMSTAPRLVIVTGRGIPADNPCFADPDNRPLVFIPQTCPEAAADAMLAAGAQVARVAGPMVDMAELLDAVAAQNIQRIVCEGGPTLLSQMSHAGLVDEVCLTTSPVWLGGGDLHLTGPVPSPLAGRFRVSRLLLGDDSTVFAQWRR